MSILDKAMADVRDAVDLAKPEIASRQDEPTVNEVTLANASRYCLSFIRHCAQRGIVQIARLIAG